DAMLPGLYGPRRTRLTTTAHNDEGLPVTDSKPLPTGGVTSGEPYPPRRRGGARAGEPYPRRWLALAVIAVTVLMIILDATIVNIALPSVSKDLEISAATQQWIVTAY